MYRKTSGDKILHEIKKEAQPDPKGGEILEILRSTADPERTAV